MRRLTLAVCCLILGTWLILPFARAAEEAQKNLQGTWTATRAQRQGKAADDVVGHRLSFTGKSFRIASKDGKPAYAGTVGVDSSAKPAVIDFEHTEGAPSRVRRGKGSMPWSVTSSKFATTQRTSTRGGPLRSRQRVDPAMS
jgi:uncharacterized protein (TIGR03067 family)